MTARVSDYKNDLYFREYSNDVPPQENLIKRVALAAIPFLSLHKAARTPISIIMGTLRVWNTDPKNIVSLTVSIIALAGNIFHHRAGIAVTTVQDVIVEIKKMQKHENWRDASKSLIKILNNLIHLSLILRGGLELSILAFAIQSVTNLVQSKDEFKSDRWIEGVSNLLMAGIRLFQTQMYVQQYKRNEKIEAAVKKVSVGELHEKWKFPSDHLPVGIEVNGKKIISWNILNNAYMEWVTEKDSQGLKGSMISDMDVPLNKEGLTIRDVYIASMVTSMTKQSHVIALQECSEPFLKCLQSHLSYNWDIAKSYNTQKTNQNVILYNKEQLTYQPNLSETPETVYPSAPNRPTQNAYFLQNQGKDFRIINAHIPGDPSKPGREEFARYVQNQHKEGITTIALGDNNFERHEMIDAYRKAGFSDFNLHSPWKTNIDPDTKRSKAIDHLFVIGDDNSKDLRPHEVSLGRNLQEMITLLNQGS